MTVAKSKLSALPIYKLNDIPEALRAMANRIECGEIDAVRVVVAIEPSDGICTYSCFGQEFTRAHAVGVLHAAAIEILRPRT